MPPERVARTLSAAAAFLASMSFVAVGESQAAPHQLDCSVTVHYDPRGQRAETRSIHFVYEDRERTLYYVDDHGQLAKCDNSAIGTLEIMGACGSESVSISKSTYQLELNTFQYWWNAGRRINEETWAYGEKGSCREIEPCESQ